MVYNDGWRCPECNFVWAPDIMNCINCNKARTIKTFKAYDTSGCPCRPENGGNGVCGCILNNLVIS